MSSPSNQEEPEKTTPARPAIETGSTMFEGKLREMILGHDPQQNGQATVPGPTHDRQLPAVIHRPSAQTRNESNWSQAETLKAGGLPNNRGGRSRARSGKPASQRKNPMSNNNEVRTAQDRTDNPIPYSIKPVRQAQKRQLPTSTHPIADSSTTVKLPVDSSNERISYDAQASGAQRYPQRYRPGTGERQANGRPLDLAPILQQGQSSFPSRTNYQHGSFSKSPQGPPYGRPLPRHQQLYNPYTGPASTNQQPWFFQTGTNNQPPDQAVVQAQIAYLDSIVREEVPKVEISRDEEQEKETMRAVLEDICQRVITEYEIEKDTLFDGSSVRLRCYGSLRTGFATQSSDMDIALESPSSKPDVSSTESNIPRLLEKALLDLGYGARLLTRTRVPLIRFCEKPTPELMVRLSEERQRWEKERDSPPKVQMVKKKADKQSKTSATKDSIPPTADGIQGKDLPTSNPLSQGETYLAESVHQVPISTPDSSDQAATSDSSDANNTNPSQGSYGPKALLSDNINDLERLSLLDTKNQQEQPDNSKPPSAEVKERREAVLPDDELIRLYKLAFDEGWFEPHERKTIYDYFNAVERSMSTDQVLECRAQLFSLPDVLNRYRPPPDHQLDYPSEGVGMQCDIIFSNPLAIHNSAMLRCYNLSDSRVKPMVLFVKAWARRRKINSPYHGTLSSYGYVLMVLHYLINVARPPICLNLQTVAMAARDASVENTHIIDGYGVRFWRNESEIQQWARNGLITADRHSTVGSLLKGFFQYFALPRNGGFSWGMDVLSLRSPTGILSKSAKGWVAAKTEVLDPSVEGQRGQEVRHRYLFAIEDPFETNHNIARTVVHNGIVAIRDEFRRAHRLILEAGNGRIIEDLFAEAASKNDLNYRHFGPRPRAPVNEAAGQAAKPKGGQTQTDTPCLPDTGNVLRAADHIPPKNV
ncbi:MAG: hypothetical protein Q9216_005341 [Gyalolechia sp. 2 TL-2023]